MQPRAFSAVILVAASVAVSAHAAGPNSAYVDQIPPLKTAPPMRPKPQPPVNPGAPVPTPQAGPGPSQPAPQLRPLRAGQGPVNLAPVKPSAPPPAPQAAPPRVTPPARSSASAPPPPARPPADPTPPSHKATGLRLQIGAFSSRAEANAALSKARAANSGSLTAADFSARPVTVSGRTLFRAQISGFASSAEAARACAALRRAGIDCFVWDAAR